MVKFKKFLQVANQVAASKKTLNWYPGHMYSGMQAMVGRNKEFKQQLGAIKPHVLVLNKCDLADLSRWNSVKERLQSCGDQNLMLCDLTGRVSLESRNFTQLLSKVIEAINRTDRYNRMDSKSFKLMVVGIPNCGKSTLINRLRQHHLGKGGEAVRTGASAGVTRHVEYMVKVSSRPPIYVLDTPGVLQPSATKGYDQAMQLALCASINDKVLNPVDLVSYLLRYLNEREDLFYSSFFGLENQAIPSTEILLKQMRETRRKEAMIKNPHTEPDVNKYNDETLLWHFIKLFRLGNFGKIMFDKV